MTFSSDPIKTEYQYQYIWTTSGLLKKPIIEDLNPFDKKEAFKATGIKIFESLQMTSTNNVEKPNTIFSKNVNQKPEIVINKNDEDGNNVSRSTTTGDTIAQTNNSTDNSITNSSSISNGSNTKQKKSGESIDERLIRYYTKYKNASPEEKEKLLDKYITQSYSEIKGRTKEEQIEIQLSDYKKLLSNTTNFDSYEMLARRINILEKENQVGAAKAAIYEQEDIDLRKRGEIGVAKTIHNCDKGNQIDLTKLIVTSKNVEAINIGASHASELNKTNQVGAVDIYKTADISKEDKIQLGQTIIDQYAKFDVANQVPIHTSMSDKNYWESQTIEYAASNIYNMDKTNQSQAVQITMNTGNEAAMNTAAANYAKYDESARAEIKTIINNSDCESAKTALSKTEESAKEEKLLNEKNNQTVSDSQRKDNEKSNITEQVKEIIKSKTPGTDVTLSNLIKRASDAEKINLLSTLSDNDLKKVIKLLLQDSPSINVLSKVMSLSSKLNPTDQKEIMACIKNTNIIKLVETQTLDYSSQSTFLDFKAQEGNLKQINSNKLCAALKEKYFKIKKEQDTKLGNQVG